jgi:hypothetical protein
LEYPPNRSGQADILPVGPSGVNKNSAGIIFRAKQPETKGYLQLETAWEVRGYIPPMAKILIVDDEPDASRAVGFYLEKCGHQVTCVRNGRDLSKVAP